MNIFEQHDDTRYKWTYLVYLNVLNDSLEFLRKMKMIMSHVLEIIENIWRNGRFIINLHLFSFITNNFERDGS